MKSIALITIMGLAAVISIPSVLADDKPGSWRGQSITEFKLEENKEFDWEVVNDGVMGGLSKGKLNFTDDGTMRFTGELSLKNNGGFSTVRSGNVNFDLSGEEGLLLKVKGDGRTYDARLGSDASFRGMEVSFSGKFETKKDEWIQVKIPFSSFKGSFRGMNLPNEKLNTAKVRRLGILLGDKKEGPFDVEIEWIRTYGKGKGSVTQTQTSTGGRTIVDVAVADGRFKTLAAVATKAGLIDVLSGDKKLTVFAPTDEAFNKLPKEVVSDLLKPENKDRLVAILTYHVSPGAAKLGDALKAGTVPTVQGENVTVAFEKGAVKINDASLIDSDIECSNGVLHVIDTILLPPKPASPTLLSVAEEAGAFSTLLAAINAANLTDALSGDGPFTVFAPTDDAFRALPKGTLETLLKDKNRDDLASILKYHVIPGKVSAGDALNSAQANSLLGSELKFAVKDGKLKVNDSTISSVDIDGGNGVIHVIDSVLIPSEADSKNASQNTMSSVDSLITAAIDKGVPLYNNGDAEGCASVYRECIEALNAMDDLDSNLRKMLSSTLKSGDERTSAISRAWLYRRALDTIYRHSS